MNFNATCNSNSNDNCKNIDKIVGVYSADILPSLNIKVYSACGRALWLFPSGLLI